MQKEYTKEERVKELKIDKDCIVPPAWKHDYICLVIFPICKAFDVTIIRIRNCLSSKKGEHYYITIKPAIDSTTANRIQYLLGDDAKRVALGQARINSHLPRWNKLFEKANKRLRTLYRKKSCVSVRRFKSQRDFK